MSKDENDPYSLQSNSNNIKRLISMTKQFWEFLQEFDLDQPSLNEFWNLKQKIVAFNGQKMFEFLEEGTKF